MEYNAENFWRTVRAISKTKNITQDLICQTCGISISTFRHWIGRNVYPDALQTYNIAKTLGTSVEYLVTGEESSQTEDKINSMKSTLIDFIEKLQP